VSSVSSGLYFPTLPLVSVLRVIYTPKEMSKKVGVARYTLGARYLSKNTVLSVNRSTKYFVPRRKRKRKPFVAFP
jgi:hypothetical protein